MKISLKKKIAAAAVAATIAGGAGIAFAYWTTTGSGTGSAATTAGVDGTLTFATATLAAMYPGDSAQGLVVTVTNPDADESVYVSSVRAFVTVVGSGPACAADDFLLNGSPAPGTASAAVELGWADQELIAGGNAATTGDTIQFNNKPAADQDDCKSAAVTLNYLAS